MTNALKEKMLAAINEADRISNKPFTHEDAAGVCAEIVSKYVGLDAGNLVDLLLKRDERIKHLEDALVNMRSWCHQDSGLYVLIEEALCGKESNNPE